MQGWLIAVSLVSIREGDVLGRRLLALIVGGASTVLLVILASHLLSGPVVAWLEMLELTMWVFSGPLVFLYVDHATSPHGASARSFPRSSNARGGFMKGTWRCWMLTAVVLGGCGEEPAGPPPDPELHRAGRIQFPEASWVEVERPAEWGWDEQALGRARERFEQLESAAVMIVHRGVLIADWGATDQRYNGQSIRKALLGALLGQEEAAGRLSLEATLGELGIDDAEQPLTDGEKSARVVDLLHSSGGIYLSALYEAPSWKRYKPERGSSSPGARWYYSNWEFNALGTIFERVSGRTIHEAFAERIAAPLGMQDYRPQDVHYLASDSLTERLQENRSEHRAYVFMVSARDLARFGLMVLAEGRWRGDQVVPADWIARSTALDTVETQERLDGDRYGYLWWVSPPESAMGRVAGAQVAKATGGRGHKLLVIPELGLVVVHRLATGGVGLLSQLGRRLLGAPSVGEDEFLSLLELILEAHPARRSGGSAQAGSRAAEPESS